MCFCSLFVFDFFFFIFFFFFNDTATTEIYTLSLHDALPICHMPVPVTFVKRPRATIRLSHEKDHVADRKSTRLNSSHVEISYAVFCLKKKKKTNKNSNKRIKTQTTHHTL